MAANRSKLMLDTSVLIAGVLSPEGGAGAILEACVLGLVKLYLTPGIVKEATNKFAQKFPDLAKLWQAMLAELKPNILPNPSTKEIFEVEKLIEKTDAPILAGAIKARVDYLITLDNDFFAPGIANSVNITIVTPGNFLKDYSNQNL